MATCSGCGCCSENLPEYDEAFSVEEDGTYANGMFVCCDCLLRLGIVEVIDSLEPEIVQDRARLLSKD